MFNERNYIDDWLKFEAEGDYSRSMGVLAAGALKSGTVLGQFLSAGATVEKAAGFVGAGTLTVDATDPVLSGAQLGEYRVRCIAEASNSGTFRVTAPDGSVLGDVVVGATFANNIKFVIADSGEDFDIGDTFIVTAAEGNGRWGILNPDATDGTEIAAGVLIEDADASEGIADAVILRRQAIVMPEKMIWPDGISSDEKALALANLESVGILSDRVGA